MTITSISHVLLFLFLIPIGLFFYIVFMVYKQKKEKIYELIGANFVLFFLLLITLNYVGLKTSNLFSESVNFLRAISMSRKALFFEYELNEIMIAMYNKNYLITYYVGVFSASFFTLYSIIASFSFIFINAFRLRFYRSSKVTYIFGELDKIDIYLSSLEQSNAFKSRFFSIFRFSLDKIILVLPYEYKHENLFLHTRIKYAVMYRHIDETSIKNIIKTHVKHKQTMISLSENDELNTKLLNGIYELVVLHHRTFENEFPIETKKYLELENKKLFNDEKYIELKQKIKSFEDSNLKFEAFIPFNDLDTFDTNELHKSLKHVVNFYSYQQIISHEFNFKHSIVNHSNIEHQYVFVGFGVTNRRILKDLLINNSIPHINSHYTVITNDDLNTKTNFIQDINYLKHLDNDEYLEKPNFDKLFTQIDFETCDINRLEFYNVLDQILTNKQHITFIISIGKDIVNIQAAHIILKYLKTHNLTQSSTIEVRIKNYDMDISKLFDIKKDIIHAFGQYKNVYTYQQIIHEDYKKFAVDIYQAIRKNESMMINQSWQSLPLYDQNANMYAFLSLRNKLRLLGFDLSKEGDMITYDEFIKAYNQGKDFNYMDKTHELNIYLKHNIRNKIASYEHERWNTYMIINGYVPMRLDIFKKRLDMKSDANHTSSRFISITRDPIKKQHICITTYHGLWSLGQMIKTFNEKNETDYHIDYFKYDYLMMDNIYQIINESSYKIVKMEDNL